MKLGSDEDTRSRTLVLLALAAAVAVNTWRHPSRQVAVAPAPPLQLDTQAAAQRLAGAHFHQLPGTIDLVKTGSQAIDIDFVLGFWFVGAG